MKEGQIEYYYWKAGRLVEAKIDLELVADIDPKNTDIWHHYLSEWLSFWLAVKEEESE